MKVVDFKNFWQYCERCEWDDENYWRCGETGRECDMKFDYSKDRPNCPKGRPATLQEIFSMNTKEGTKWAKIIKDNNNEEIPEYRFCDAHLWSSFGCPWFMVKEND